MPDSTGCRGILACRPGWTATAIEERAIPGIAILGGDGSREQLALDVRSDPAPVLLIDIASDGWESGIRQAGDVSQLIDSLEAGTFSFDFGGPEG